MNQRLADFLFDLLRNPEKLRRFNTEEGREEILAQGFADGALLAADVAALQGESEDVLIRLQASFDDLMWVVGPGIKPPRASALIGWGIKPPRSEPELRRKPAPTSRKGGMARKSTTPRSKKGAVAGKRSKAPARKRKGGKR